MPYSLPNSDFTILRYGEAARSGAVKREPPPEIQTTSTWTHVGAPLDIESLPPSYHTWSRGTFVSGDILSLLSPFLAFLREFMADTHMTHYCLSIRAQKANTDFETPRWHVDRRFFDAELPQPKSGQRPKLTRSPSNWKVAAALLGPGTIFLKDGAHGRKLAKEIESRLKVDQRKKGHYAVDSDHVCTSFRCLGCADMADAVRVELATALKSVETVQVGQGEVVVFKVDGYNACDGEPAMHSEPPMSGGDRVFVHVVPGREEELKRLVEGWGMEFPRDWCVGVLQDLES